MLTPAEQGFVAGQRRATLATVAPDGAPRLVPICFVLEQAPDDAWVLYSPLDEKPKASDDPKALARVRDIEARPRVTLLFDHWEEDWAELAWVRVHGTATLLAAAGPTHHEHAPAIARLRAKYPQYRTQAIDERPLIRIALTRARSWGLPGSRSIGTSA